MSDQTINPPDLDDIFAESRNSLLANINCIQIGKIEKVNNNQTVEIMIQVKRRVSGTEIADYPILVDCPYIVLQGGGAYLDFPIAVGDYCIVLFNDRNIDNWWSTGNVKEPADKRKHSLSDGMALIGVNPDSNFLERDGSVVRLLGTSGPGSEEFAARKNDQIQIDATTDPAFFTWLASVGTATGVGAPPSPITGKISTGSTEVKIG